MRSQASTILRWPLWSWRNLSITAAAILLVLYGLGRVIEPAKITLTTNHSKLAGASPMPSSPSPPISSGDPSLPAGAMVPDATPPTSADSGARSSESVTRVATAFARAWSSSGRSQQEWTRGIQPFVTPALAAGLAQTDPARVPATKVCGNESTARLDVESTSTELGRALVTSIEQTVLDLASMPALGVAEDQIPEALRALLPRCDLEIHDELAARQRPGSALHRARAWAR